jgi:hypothetical protein
MRKIVEKSLPLTKVIISFTDLMTPMEPTAANDALGQQFERVNLDIAWDRYKPLIRANEGPVIYPILDSTYWV